MPRAITPPILFFSVLSGLLLGFSFPPFGFSFLAWVFLVPLFLSESDNRLNLFIRGLIAGTIGNFIIFSWIWKTFQAAEVSVFTTLPAWFFLALVLGLYGGIFLWALSFVKSDALKPWIGAALWVALDSIKSHILTGFPWALLSHSQATHLNLIQIASLTGAEGMTFLIVLFNLSLAIFIRKIRTPKFLGLAMPLILIGGVYGWGRSRLNEHPSSSVRTLRIAVLQGNIDQYQKWDLTYEKSIREVYDELARTALLGTPDLMIWPESAVPGWYPNERIYVDWIRRISHDTKAAQLFGAVSSREGKDFNSAFLVDVAGLMENSYDKIHLVPFGEYIPFGKPLAKIVPYLGKLGTFTAGSKPVVFKFKGINLAPNICYEAVFPGLVRGCVKAGGEVLINLTNDGWYLDTGAPMQHYVTNIFRAIENGRILVRAANTGISAALDFNGREIFRSPLNERGIYFADLSVPDDLPQTFFNKFGSWFTYLCWIFCLFVYSGPCLAKLNFKSKN